MKPSILRNILLAFLGFGLSVGAVFPFYAGFFVEYREGLYGWFVTGCVVAGTSIGIINYYLLNILLFAKLKHIAQVSTAISNHDLSYSCKIESHDVIGDIITGSNKMADTLRNVVSELKTSGEQILNGVNQICVVADATSHGVQNQNNQTQNIEIAIQHMTQIARDVSSKAAQAAEAAAIAKEEAEKGNNVVEETIRSIQLLAAAVETAAESINRVETESLNIGGVLDVIQGVSEQTNLLALNAAIEAARAGEQGRGFAVVADEVRTLAQRTQQSTKEIQSMIETLQTVSKNTVSLMKEGQIQATDSVKHATEAGNSLQQITHAVQAITEMNTLINDEAGSQSGVAVEINKNMHAISEIATESMNGAEKTNQESQQLADLANNLQQLVDKFKL